MLSEGMRSRVCSSSRRLRVLGAGYGSSCNAVDGVIEP